MNLHLTRRHHPDRKIALLETTWVTSSHDDAVWLASVADLAVSEPSRQLDTRRFNYIPVDQAYAGTVITGRASQATMPCPTTVLVIGDSELGELARRSPSVANALVDA